MKDRGSVCFLPSFYGAIIHVPNSKRTKTLLVIFLNSYSFFSNKLHLHCVFKPLGFCFIGSPLIRHLLLDSSLSDPFHPSAIDSSSSSGLLGFWDSAIARLKLCGQMLPFLLEKLLC